MRFIRNKTLCRNDRLIVCCSSVKNYLPPNRDGKLGCLHASHWNWVRRIESHLYCKNSALGCPRDALLTSMTVVSIRPFALAWYLIWRTCPNGACRTNLRDDINGEQRGKSKDRAHNHKEIRNPTVNLCALAAYFGRIKGERSVFLWYIQENNFNIFRLFSCSRVPAQLLNAQNLSSGHLLRQTACFSPQKLPRILVKSGR